MGLHKTRRFWTYSQIRQNHRPDALWETPVRFTSACDSCGSTWWAHPTPRINCPSCGAYCVVSEETIEKETNP